MNKFINVLIGIGVLGVIASFFVGPKETEVEMQSDTMEWKTYTHPQNLYTIQHPSYWSVETVDGPMGSSMLTLSLFAPDWADVGPGAGRIEISATANPNNLSGQQEWELRRQNAQDPDDSLTRGNVQLAGQTAFRLTFTGGEAFFLPYQENMYEIHASGNAAQKARLDQILATLEFIESPMVSNVSTLKTYHNTQYGFSLEYPAMWQFKNTQYSGRVDVDFSFIDVESTLGYGDELFINVWPKTGTVEQVYQNNYSGWRKLGEVMIGGKLAYSLQLPESDSPTTYIVVSDNFMFRISLRASEEISDHILSSLKFTK